MITFKHRDSSKEVICLNNPYINRVIQDYHNTFFDEDIKLRDIKYIDSPKNPKTAYRLFIKGKPILYFDRHHHYPNPNYQLIGVCEYLRFVKSVLEARSRVDYHEKKMK